MWFFLFLSGAHRRGTVSKRSGRVTADIDNVEARGQVKLGGMEWTARSTSGDPISVGTEVRVDRVEGVKVYVTPVEAAVTV